MRTLGLRSPHVTIGIVFAALMVSGPAATEAKTKKRIVSAAINGQTVKWKGRLVIFREESGHGFVAVATKIRATKTIGFGCATLLEGQAFPLDGMACNANYAVRKRGVTTTWLNTGLDATNPFHVTFQSSDGTVVQGTFSGTLPPATGGAAPLSVQGSFQGPLTR